VERKSRGSRISNKEEEEKVSKKRMSREGKKEGGDWETLVIWGGVGGGGKTLKRKKFSRGTLLTDSEKMNVNYAAKGVRREVTGHIEKKEKKPAKKRREN